MTKLYEFIKNVSAKRVENARILIENYNSKTEESVKKEISKLQQENQKLERGEKLTEIQEVSAMEVDNSFDKNKEDGILYDHNPRKPFKIEARDIVLKPYTILNENFLMSMNSSEDSDFIRAYQSTPSFIKRLTEISDQIMTFQTPKEKKVFMKSQLCELNKKLPAQVYIPFVSKSMRNYAVLNICVEEAKIFQTKERAPLLLCIQVYRPIEMTLEEPNEVHDEEQFKGIIKSDAKKLDRQTSRDISPVKKSRTITLEDLVF